MPEPSTGDTSAGVIAAVVLGLALIVLIWLNRSRKQPPRRERAESAPLDKVLEGLLLTAFDVAAEKALNMRAALPVKQRLRLYSYFKQAKFGDAPSADTLSPWTSIVDRTKHGAWSRRTGMSPEAAAAKYVAIVDALAATASGSGSDREGSSVNASMRARARSQATEAEAKAELLERVRELEARLARLSTPAHRGWLCEYKQEAFSWIGSQSKWEPRYFVLSPHEHELSC
jgi:acyl-CoA-binding protein